MSAIVSVAVNWVLMTMNGQANEGINPQCVFIDMFDIAKLISLAVLPPLIFKKSLSVPVN